MNKNIEKTYKKESTKNIDSVRKLHEKTVTELNLDDRVFETTSREAFFTLKDHKPNFQNSPTCRLINPCKPEIGKMGKQIVARIVIAHCF